MVPEGWSVYSLQSLADSKIVYGIVQAGPQVDDGVPYIKSTDVGRGIPVESLSKTAHEIHQRFRRSVVVPGDIVISLRGNTGAVAIVPDSLTEANLTQGTARISPKPGIDRHFLSYQLQSPSVRSAIYAASKGSTFTEISLADLRTLSITLPPLPEQRKIAEILSTWDRAIETTEALLAAAKAQKRALMQTLLTGKRRFPEFEGQPLKTAALGSLARITKGEQKSRATLDSSGEYPVINGGVSPSGYCDEWNAEAYTISISEGGNSCGYVKLMRERFWSGGHCYTLSGLKVERDFLFHALKFNEPAIMRLRVGSGLPNIQKKSLQAFSILVPVAEEQRAIARCLNTAREEEDLLQASLDKLRTEKSALMQQLLTGKRRVRV